MFHFFKYLESLIQATSKHEGETPHLRIIDANINRLKEGIRVVEDIYRYEKNDANTATKLKDVRHKARIPNYFDALAQRDVPNDGLKKSSESEKKRESIEGIIIANLKRAQESGRVLEEIFKLSDIETSELFKSIRYELYVIEQEIFNKQ